MRMIEELPALQRPAHCPIAPARPVWYRVQAGAACPASGRVCLALRGLPWYLPALVLARPALLPVMRSLFGCAGWGREPPAGYTGSAVGGAGHARDKIFQRKRRFSGVVLQTTHPTFTNQNPSDCASLQKFRKIQKDLFQCLDCAIIN